MRGVGMIPNNHFDGTVHEVPFEKGLDFITKHNAYRRAGFGVAIHDGHLKVFITEDVITRRAQILDALVAAGHSVTTANCIVERAAVGEAEATTIIRKAMT
jgi:hypothetical protein